MCNRLLLVLLMLSATAAGAGELWVSPGGRDANPGTKEAPFATVQRAADIARAGDTVLIGTGTYGGFEVKGSGRAPVTFRAAAGEKPVIKPARGDAILIADKSHVIVDGLCLDGGGTKEGARRASSSRGGRASTGY